MPDEILFEHEELEDVLASESDNIGTERGGDRDLSGEGIDPETAAFLEEGDREDAEEDEEESDRVERGRRVNREAEEEGERSGAGMDAVHTELASGGASGGGAGGFGATPSAFDNYRSQMPATQVNPMQYANYMPTPATATQYDMNNAPNRAALQAAILDAVRDGSGAPGDDRPRAGGGRLGGLSDDEHDRAAQEIQQKYVDSDIWYAWGGGHGPEPGLTQGIRDGGYADKNGDYAKQGLDCSGYSRAFTYDMYGVDIGAGTAADQYNSGRPISPEEARPGDIFFPDSAGRPPQHVQVYAGNGMVSEAQQSGTKLMFSNLESGEFRRFVD